LIISINPLFSNYSRKIFKLVQQFFQIWKIYPFAAAGASEKFPVIKIFYINILYFANPHENFEFRIKMTRT